MTDPGSVAVIGLGHMGSGIASAFVASGRTVVIWNRTWEKAAPLASHALVAASPVEACEVADTVVVSLLDYSAVADVLHTAEVEQTLSGKTVVQLSTGTPSEARREGEWAAARGISYIDGAILGYPRAIGTEQIVVLCAGRRALFDEKLAALRALGGEPIYCGEAVDAASILDLALIHVLFVLVTGILHSAALCDGEGFPLETFFGALPAWVAG